MEERASWLEDDHEGSYDAVVVGSGYGGSVAACRIATAGIKVCLVERGRRWEAEDFPTNTLKLVSATRMESHRTGLSFGPKDGLFQVHERSDSLAVVACGLGGGSLINGGVMLPTPVRARRNPKWPKEWEREWEACQASASAMLRAQSVPVKFPVTKVMEHLDGVEIEEGLDGSMKLSVNFEPEESEPSSSAKTGSCLACGNCMSGCPYNAKNSTDKNYLVSAVQAGCSVRTGCQALYVVENSDEVYRTERFGSRRRWRIYLNETDYITADFVVLSAGVFGTTDILLQSRMRGLKLSESLGCGVSCNGNTVAYMAGSSAPLNGYGLGKRQFSQVPFRDRPGPSITSYHTSSLGFTIQPAILPNAYPHMLSKGIFTYGWPSGFWFFHGIIDKIKYIIGMRSSQAIALNAMGYDASDGKIFLEAGTGKICFDPPRDPLYSRKIEAFQKLAKKLGGFLFISRYRSTSVHLLGGCNVSSDSAGGVCNYKGQVYDRVSNGTAVHKGLYVCDASLVPCSVGINPALTITAAAEYVSRHIVQDILENKNKGHRTPNTSAPEDTSSEVGVHRLHPHDRQSTVQIKEVMKGSVGGVPCTAHLAIRMNVSDVLMKGSNPILRGKVGGYVSCRAIDKDKLHIIDGEVDLCVEDCRTPYTQYMSYRLLLAASSGSRYILKGNKTLNPFLLAMYAWKETTTMSITIKEALADSSREEKQKLKGELRVSLIELLKSLVSLKGSRRGRFINLFSQNLVRTYILQIPRGSHKDSISLDSHYKNYPSCSILELTTDDGCVISCRKWECSQNQFNEKGNRQKHPVLLLNGYYGESYHLPTESSDLVRTLLEEGHEVWLLQPRLHPLNPANDFTIEDIGKFDIPSAIRKILELHDPGTRVHVVAHCLGGLALHIALMGGHVSAKHIASLSCTNTSMYFKLTAFSAFKMWLPLVPISMAILGKDKILPLLEKTEASSRHWLLKCIANFIPRYERCSCKECHVVSGIFGNAFWHQNLTSTMHHWLTKVSWTTLPMSAFPHLRKICKSGFIMDRNGKNSYMCHPERMAVSTLYISGGRTLLVTPKTSFLANNYMKLHQPGFRHERVVVEGFGHSDLLIGEKSHKKVFPHILSHIKMAEEEATGARTGSHFRKKYSQDAIEWGEDPYGNRHGNCGSWFSAVVVALWLVFVLVIVSLF